MNLKKELILQVIDKLLLSILLLVFTGCIMIGSKEKKLEKGIEWNVKTTKNVHGPGNNIWGQKDVVKATERGIEFGISVLNEVSNCSELYSKRSDFGYGTYTFQMVGNVNQFSDNTVLGIFLYQNKPVNPLEIDIELTKWNKVNGPNLHYTLHNFEDIPAVPVSSNFTMKGNYFTCFINWTPSGLYLGVFHGHIEFSEDLKSKMYFRKPLLVDQLNDFRIHLNFWKMLKGDERSEKETVVLTRFKYQLYH